MYLCKNPLTRKRGDGGEKGSGIRRSSASVSVCRCISWCIFQPQKRRRWDKEIMPLIIISHSTLWIWINGFARFSAAPLTANHSGQESKRTGKVWVTHRQLMDFERYKMKTAWGNDQMKRSDRTQGAKKRKKKPINISKTCWCVQPNMLKHNHGARARRTRSSNSSQRSNSILEGNNEQLQIRWS